MEYPASKLHRLKSWDYGQPGYYHVTVCTHKKLPLLCTIRQKGLETTVKPTEIGVIVEQNWNKLGSIYPNIKTDYFCLMPNHIHGIIIIEPSADSNKKSLDYVVRGFKSVTTRAYKKHIPEGALWQTSYYDEIIRDEEMLRNTRNYIAGNPSKWLEDEMYTE